MSQAGRFDRVLVTGASGFVGACLVRKLLRQGREVHVVLRGPTRPWRLEDVHDRLIVHQADLCDAAEVSRALDVARPEAVYHLAAFGAYESQSDARVILQTNVLGTYNLLEASARCGVRAFINTGSSSEYGFKSEPMREADRLEPNSWYAVGKAAQSHLCSLMAGRSTMAVVVFRLFSVYGPWEEPSRLVPTVLRRARAGLPLEMVAPGVARDFIYVEDVLTALLDLERIATLRGEVINLGTGIETTLQEFVATATDLLHSSSPVRWGAMPPRHWDTTRWVADISKARRLLEWAPRHSLRQGLAATLAWMTEREDHDGTEDARPAA